VIFLIAHGDIGPKEIGTAFLAMVGTFLGALFAFRLNESKENTKIEKERMAALNRALFILARQYNAILSLDKAMVPYKSDFEKAFNCPALRPPSYSDLVQDFSAIGFLLDVVDPNVLMRLSVEQEGFHQTLESLRIRNEFYVNEVQPAIAQHGFNRRDVHAPEFQAALSERIFGTAMNSAKIMYSNVAEDRKNLLNLHGEVFATAKKLFPDARFIKLVPEEQPRD